MRKFLLILLCINISCVSFADEWIAWMKQWKGKKMVVDFPSLPIMNKKNGFLSISAQREQVVYTLNIYERGDKPIEALLDQFCSTGSPRNLMFSHLWFSAEGTVLELIFQDNAYIQKEKVVIAQDRIYHFVTDFREGTSEYHDRFSRSMDFVLEIE